jgi:hypothetical protein
VHTTAVIRSLVLLCLLAGVASADGSSGKPRCVGADACKKACAKGDAEGCWTAGAGFEPGDAGPGDLRKAKPFYDRACKLGLARGCTQLANAERATPGDKGMRASNAAIKRAIALEAKACAKKDAAACEAVAGLYATRLDKPDDKNAALFREKACQIRTNAPCPPPCVDDPGGKEALDVATAANDKRFGDELARQHLRAVTLTQRRWPAMSGSMKVRAGTWTVNSVAEVEAAGGTVRVVVAPDIGDGCRTMQKPLEYAQKDKTIYRVERAPRTTSSKSFKVCSCGPSCGGPRPAMVHVGYEMPPGTVYGGAVKIAYDLEDVRLMYQACAPAP